MLDLSSPAMKLLRGTRQDMPQPMEGRGIRVVLP